MKFQNRILIIFAITVCCLVIVNSSFLKRDDATKDNSAAFDSKTSAIEDKKVNSYTANNKKEGETKEEAANNAKIKYADQEKMSIPEVNAPVLYTGPPNLEKRSDALEPIDAFNPSNRPPPIADEYPYYDAFPPMESFWEGNVVPLKKIVTEPPQQQSSKPTRINADNKMPERVEEKKIQAPQRKAMSESEIHERLEKELTHLKNELFNGDEGKIKKIRESKQAYDSKWLRKQLKITRVLELEDIIKAKNNAKK
jgi:hypothetical protein